MTLFTCKNGLIAGGHSSIPGEYLWTKRSDHDWRYTKYLTIKPVDYYTTLDAFSNADGEINEDLARAEWRVTFTDKGENTLVETVVNYQSLADLETAIEMGMEQGMTATLKKLDESSITSKWAPKPSPLCCFIKSKIFNKFVTLE